MTLYTQRMRSKQRYQATRTVSLVNAAINLLLAIIKVIVGWIGQSHALFADGIHSFSDLFNDALVLITAKAGSRHPDHEHPYGHRRIETIGAIIISIMLILVAAGIAMDAFTHLLRKTPSDIKEISVLVVALISIFANEFLYRYTLKVGKKIHSNLLITNAWHNRGDALVSVVVLLSTIGSLIGLHYLDAIGAIIIALLIFKMGAQMLWNGVKELIDTGVEDKTLEKIKHHINTTPGVGSIHQLRTRLSGGQIFIDLHIIVDPFISVSEGHYISDQVYLNLLKNISNIADVTVHIDPEDDEQIKPSSYLPNREQILQTIKPYWQSLEGYTQIQKTTLHYLGGFLYIEIFIPQSAIHKTDPIKLVEQYREIIQHEKTIASVAVHFMP